MSFETDPRWTALVDQLTLGRPVNGSGELIGRRDAIARVFNVVGAAGEHLVIFGEQGVGKSSLLNALAEELRGAGVGVFQAEVQPGDGFDALIRRAVGDTQGAPNDEMRFAPLPPGAEDGGEDGGDPLAEMLPEGEAGPGDIAEFLDQTLAGHPVLILDDYHRLADAMADRAVCDLIKALSEAKSQATVILCGQAGNAEDLIDNHDRVFDFLVEVPLRLFRPNEILHVLDRAADATGLAFQDDARKLILTASLGLPGAVQALTRDAVAATLAGGKATVGTDAVLAAFNTSAEAVADEVRTPVDALVGEDPEDEMAQTLFAVAAAHTDGFGRFFKAQVMVSLRRRYPHLDEGEEALLATLDSLAGEDADSLLHKRGTEYRFASIWMKHYLLLRYLAWRHGKANSAPIRAVS